MSEDTSVVKRHISLPPRYDGVVIALDDGKGLGNYSAALRMIISEWLTVFGPQHSIALAACDGATENDGSHE